MSHGLNNRPASINRRAFSLIEVLIAIVVLALGLLGIASVFPAVVSQQRSTTDAVQGIALSKSVEALLRSHHAANRQSFVPSAETHPLFGTGVVDDRELKGWASLTGLPAWSEPQEAIDDFGLWTIPETTARPPGLLLNATNGTVIVMGTVNNPTWDRTGEPQYTTPGFRLEEGARLIGYRPTSGNQLLRGDYIFDFAARRAAAGRRFDESGTAVDQSRTCQDDHLQLAVFIRRVDRPGSVPGVGVAVGEDAQLRPTFNGTGNYSPIRRAPFTIPPAAQQTEYEPSGEQLVVLAPQETTTLRYMRQLGQKFVSPWGSVHVVADFGPNNNEVVIKPMLDPTQVSDYAGVTPAAQGLEFLYTLQVPVAVDIVRIAPKIVK